MKNRFLWLFLFICTYYTAINAQGITGNWYGTGYIKAATESNNYLTELVIEKKQNKYTGFFNFYFRDSLFSNTVNGIYDAAARKLILNKQPIIFYKSTNTKIGIDCFMKSDFTYRASKIEETLSGVLYPEKEQRFTCPEIYFSFKRENTVPIVKEKAITESLDSALLTPEEIAFTQRNVTVMKQLSIENNSIEIELTDNGEIDGDIVSIFLDGKLLLSKQNLSYKPIVCTIDVSAQKNKFVLSMYAENTGLIAPNTALLLVKDGNKKYEMVISSSLSNTTGIELIRAKK